MNFLQSVAALKRLAVSHILYTSLLKIAGGATNLLFLVSDSADWNQILYLIPTDSAITLSQELS